MMTTRVESVKRFFSPLFLTIYSRDEIHCKCNATALEELICNDDLRNNIWESKNKLDEGYKRSLTLAGCYEDKFISSSKSFRQSNNNEDRNYLPGIS